MFSWKLSQKNLNLIRLSNINHFRIGIDRSQSDKLIPRLISSINQTRWRLSQNLVDFEQKHGNPPMDLLL